MTESSFVQTADADRVRTITFARPKALNAFNNVMYVQAAEAVAAADADAGVGAIMLTGEGRAFSAGQDLSEMSMPEPGETLGFEHFVNALVACKKPVLTAVNGVGVGIGLTMLLHTDINFISSKAKLCAPFTPLGVVPEAGSSYLLASRIGHQRAAWLLLSGSWMSAQEAVDSGLCLQLCEPDELIEVAHKAAAKLAALPPNSVAETKRLMRAAERTVAQAARDGENDAFRSCLGSPENVAAIAAFFAKK